MSCFCQKDVDVKINPFDLMEQIMEFFLNLLLIKGKFLTDTAARTLHQAIRRCLHLKSKISTEYKNATQTPCPYENMMDMMNYNAREYTCEGDNIVVTREYRCRLYEQLCKIKEQELKRPIEKCVAKQNRATVATVDLIKKEVANWTDNQSKQLKRDKAKVNDHLIDNLYAILKSQEFLFKNVIKLVHLIEQTDSLGVDERKLSTIKTKLMACTNILSTHKKFPDNIINNIIEEEITRCRFRQGEAKSLKGPELVGLEVVLGAEDKVKPGKSEKPERKSKKRPRPPKFQLDKKNEVLAREALCYEIECRTKKPKLELPPAEPEVVPKITMERKHEKFLPKRLKAEVKLNSASILKRYKSASAILTHRKSEINPAIGLRIINEKREATSDINNDRKFLEVNAKQFQGFEESLWHSLTTAKYKSLKNEYKNMVKLAFYNKRHFVNIDRKITEKELEMEKNENRMAVFQVNDAAFQGVEEKLKLDQEREKEGQLTILTRQEFEKLEEQVQKRQILMTQIEEATKAMKTNEDQFQKLEDAIKEENKLLSTMTQIQDVSKTITSNQDQFQKLENELKRLSMMTQIEEAAKAMKTNEDQFLKLEDEIKEDGKLLSVMTQVEEATKAMKTNEDQFQKLEDEIKEDSKRLSVMTQVEDVTKTLKTNEFQKLEKKIKEDRRLTMMTQIDDDTKRIKTSEDHFQKFEGEVEQQLALMAQVEEESKKMTANEDQFERLEVKLENASPSNRQENILKAIIADDKQRKVLDEKIQEEILKHIIGQNSPDVMSLQENVNKSIVTAADPRLMARRKSKIKKNVDAEPLSLQQRFPKLDIKGNFPKRLLPVFEMQNHAEVLKINKKVFDEFERTLKTVPVFVDNPIVARNKATAKAKDDNKSRRLGEPTKYNMSTNTENQEKIVLKQEEKRAPQKKLKPPKISLRDLMVAKKALKEMKAEENPVKQMESDSKLAQDIREEIKLKRQKSKTFLKSSSEITYNKYKSVKFPFCKVENKTEAAEKSTRTEEKAANDEIQKKIKVFPMRRTTKTAMKKQQVFTILPKIEREAIKEERKKPKVSVMETEEIKIIKAMQHRDGSKNKVVINVTKHVNYSSKHKNVRRVLQSKAAGKTSPQNDSVKLVKWEEEDINKFVNNIFSE